MPTRQPPQQQQQQQQPQQQPQQQQQQQQSQKTYQPPVQPTPPTPLKSAMKQPSQTVQQKPQTQQQVTQMQPQQVQQNKPQQITGLQTQVPDVKMELDNSNISQDVEEVTNGTKKKFIRQIKQGLCIIILVFEIFLKRVQFLMPVTVLTLSINVPIIQIGS